MEDETKTLLEGKKSEENTANSEMSEQDDDEDILYTHKPESHGNEMRWNTTLCRKPGR